MPETETYGFEVLIGLTSVECPECGYVQVADKSNTDHYQCADCLSRFGPVEGTFYGLGEEP